jgi:hypothetical protein
MQSIARPAWPKLRETTAGRPALRGPGGEETMSEVKTLLESDYRAPRNMGSGSEGSIHSDATASSLGFKGGTIAGSTHMNQFAPLLVKLWGDAWFERGDMSLYFTQATVDNEKVRCTVEPGEERARLCMYNEAGDLICEGTASLSAPDAGSALARRLEVQEPAAPGRLRIMADMRVGDECHDVPIRVTKEAQERSLSTITEELACYREKGVLSPSQIVHMAHAARSAVMAKSKSSVGLFGALEVRQLRGPVLAETDYLARTRILKLTESPRTENVWYDVIFADPKSGEDVGSVLFNIRLMKASSPLWREGTEQKSA